MEEALDQSFDRLMMMMIMDYASIGGYVRNNNRIFSSGGLEEL